MVISFFGVLSLGGCNEPSPPTEGPPIAKEQSQAAIDKGAVETDIDWDHPFPRGVEQDSVEAASGSVPFDVVSPAALPLGQPDLIQTAPPDAYPEGEGAVVFVYHTKDYGNVLVEESTPGDITVEHLVEVADSLGAPSPGSDGTPQGPDPMQIVTLGDAKGLLVQDAGIGRITWVQGGLLFDIKGDEITPEQVIDLASELGGEIDKQLGTKG